MNIRPLLLAAILVAPIAAVASPPPPAAGVLAGAEAKAKESNRNVLLVFHASWCGWCHKRVC